jgi:hypothetical protein
MVKQLEEGFRKTLEQQNSLEQWAARLKGVVTEVLKPYEGKSNFAKAAEQFLLEWTFCTSVIFRDLTLRRLASSGSLHRIRLLYEEYMFFLIDHQVALKTRETRIAAIGEKYTNDPYNVSDFTEPAGICNEDGSLTMGVPVSAGGKRAATTLYVGTNEDIENPVPTKRFKSIEQLH